MDDVVEAMARALAKEDRIEICSDASYRHSTYGPRARAAAAVLFDAVEANLLAVQYDPAPYTAMKARLAAMRRKALWPTPPG